MTPSRIGITHAAVCFPPINPSMTLCTQICLQHVLSFLVFSWLYTEHKNTYIYDRYDRKHVIYAGVSLWKTCMRKSRICTCRRFLVVYYMCRGRVPLTFHEVLGTPISLVIATTASSIARAAVCIHHSFSTKKRMLCIKNAVQGGENGGWGWLDW